MADLGRVYLDSCCFIDLAKHKIGTLPTHRMADQWFAWKFMEAQKDGAVAAFTSVLSVAECTHADNDSGKEVRDLFTRVLTTGQYVVLVQPTIFVGSDARDLRWKHGLANIRGADLMHLASALSVKCTEFLTTDEKILRHAPRLEPLGLRLTNPAKSALLPAEYRQQEMPDVKVRVLRAPKKPGAA